jgi:hypothetical protein
MLDLHQGTDYIQALPLLLSFIVLIFYLRYKVERPYGHGDAAHQRTLHMSTHTIADTIRKNHLHPSICPLVGISVTSPPIVTPQAPAADPDKEYTVNAIGNSCASKMVVMSRYDAGMRAAAVIPVSPLSIR